MVLDYATNLDYFWALLPEFILCVTGMFILVMGVSGKRDPAKYGDLGAERPSTDLGTYALVGVLLAAVVNGWLYGVTEAGTGLVTVDRFRLFANWIFLAAAVFGIVMAFDYVYRQRLQAGEFYALILFATSGMMFMAAARDLMVVFLGLEVMSTSVYALSAFGVSAIMVLPATM